MIRAYSQRLLPPYSGVVQIAESTRARAQSFDGIHWEIQYFSGNEKNDKDAFRVQGYGLDKGYYQVANIDNRELNTFSRFPACVNHDEVSASIIELYDFISTAETPFAIGDTYEYWLLDSQDNSPLALIHSCCEESLMNAFPCKAEWTALPHSKMQVENTEPEQARGEPPVNHRIQKMVANRAGANPRAAWFNRKETESGDFPSLLLREDWQSEAEHELCQRYLMRKAPRLLMLHDLPADDRDRLEVAAKQQVFEVEEYFSLYPEIIDEKRMSAIRVEARLRRATPQVSQTTRKQKPSGPSPLDKDMRIIEN